MLFRSAALNTGTQQLAENILSTPATPTTLPKTDNYSVNADYGLSAPESSGLGLKATPATLDMSNPYSFDTTLATTGGLGLNLGTAANAGNVADMGGGQGLLGGVGQGKTLSEIGSAYKNNLTNTITGNPLGEELANITTGAEAYSTNPNDLTGTPSKALSNLLGKLLMATTANTSGTGATATQNPFASIVGGLLGGAGSLYQGSTNQAANQALAEQLRQAGQTAQQQSIFRPVGTTTRFGTSSFTVDPITGQLTAAGYTVTPEMKAYQDRLSALAAQGLTGAEAARAAYEPLKTGATDIFNLGQQYLAESPEAARKRYIEQQTALVAPQQEQQLANIRNQLYQTGRGGLATGATAAGNMAATNQIGRAHV